MSIETLKSKLAKLHEKLGNTSFKNQTEDVKELIAQIREAEKQLKDAELKRKVEGINERDKIHRELMIEFLGVGLIDTNLLTNDGKLNKTKRKQNEKLYAFVDKHQYVYFEVKYGIVYAKISLDRNRFELQNSFIDYPNAKSEVELFTSIEQACGIKSILLKDITVKEVRKQLTAIDKATEKFRNACKVYENETKEANRYFLSNEHLISQSNSRVQEYTSNF